MCLWLHFARQQRYNADILGVENMSMNSRFPFNRSLFAAAMKWVVGRGNCPLDQYDMVKMHVLVDFEHILKRGEPLVGGSPAAWQYGPVVRDAYAQATEWAKTAGVFKLLERHGAASKLIPTTQKLTAEEMELLTPSAIESLAEAWKIYEPMDFQKSNEYFHSDKTPLGRVWNSAWQGGKGEGSPIDWCAVIDAYDQINKTDHSDIKTLLNAPSNDELVAMAGRNKAPDSYWFGT